MIMILLTTFCDISVKPKMIRRSSVALMNVLQVAAKTIYHHCNLFTHNPPVSTEGTPCHCLHSHITISSKKQTSLSPVFFNDNLTSHQNSVCIMN